MIAMKRHESEDARGISLQPSWEQSLAAALRTSARRYEMLRRRCRKKMSAKRVHALRIETRRLLAQIDLAGAICGAATRKLRQHLKRTLRATAQMRDAHVQRGCLKEFVAAHSELRSFYRYLRKRERRACADARPKLKAMKLGRRISRLVCAVSVPSENRFLGPSVARVFSKAVADLHDRAASIGTDADALHRARLAMKKVHYMAEVLQPVFRGQSAVWIGKLHQHQQGMGKIHDLDLLLARLAKYLEKKRAGRRSLEPMRLLLMRSRRRLLARYRAQPFPELPHEFRHWLGLQSRSRPTTITSYAAGSATNAEHGSGRNVSYAS
jgi:CHAD domain-containing protein